LLLTTDQNDQSFIECLKDANFDCEFRIFSKLNRVQRQEMESLLDSNNDLFAKNSKDRPGIRGSEYSIHLLEAGVEPISHKIRRFSSAEKEIIQTEVSHMLEIGVIEKSNPQWIWPVVLVKKKDDTWRFCIIYRTYYYIIGNLTS
jgi:hypothetical protein